MKDRVMRLSYNDIFNIYPTEQKPENGKILISDPFYIGDVFRHSVVLIASHVENEGTIGFILNKPIKDNILKKKIKKELNLKNYDVEIYIGGPVSTNQVFYIHKLPPAVIGGGLKIKENLYWGGEFDDILNALDNGIISESEIKIFIGYSGWAPNQLNDEIYKRNAWLVTDISEEEIFEISGEELWKYKLKQLDEKYRLWSIIPENPSLN